MTRLGKIAVCLAGGLVLCTGARAQNVALAGNPYQPIVVRNVFGLNPIPISTNPPVDTTLPKITPNGIMSIFGQLQVLFKVAPKPGEKDAKEQSYVLSEGQQQDDIEVVHIDEKESLVTFNNHGTVQELPLANAPALNTPAPGPGGGGGGGGVLPTRLGGNRPGPGMGGGSPVTRFGGQGRGPGSPGGNPMNAGMGNNYNNAGMGGNSQLGSAVVPSRFSRNATTGYTGQPQAQSALSPDDQMVLMAAQRAQALQNNPTTAPLFPPTPYDPEAQGMK